MNAESVIAYHRTNHIRYLKLNRDKARKRGFSREYLQAVEAEIAWL